MQGKNYIKQYTSARQHKQLNNNNFNNKSRKTQDDSNYVSNLEIKLKICMI